MKKTDWICPLCGAALTEEDGALRCPGGHSFDKARQGYCHLLPVQQKHAKNPGDNRDMVQARRRFLQTGGYAPFAEKLRQLVTDALRGKENPLLLDVGCGEGYYTGFLYDGLQKEEIPARVAGFDISKEAVRLAAGRYKGIAFAVASSFAIPVADGACDCVTEVFSPLVPEEFRRVIKPGGTLILVVPGPRHLWELKEVLYDAPYENERKDTFFDGFSFVGREEVRTRLTLDTPQVIHDLFAMTPYYWKTGEEGSRRLQTLSELKTEIAFDFLVYRREEDTP